MTFTFHSFLMLTAAWLGLSFSFSGNTPTPQLVGGIHSGSGSISRYVPDSVGTPELRKKDGWNGVADSREHPMPYKAAGLTQKAAAAHLLGRFTYGAEPGQVDEVMRMGLEHWFRLQLEGRLRDDSLQSLLSRYDALQLSNTQIAQLYPNVGALLRMARRDGAIATDSAGADRKEYREALQQYMTEKGYKPRQELFKQLYSQKIYRAVYSNNQLLEVMTDFWFNHFNVSVTKNDCADFIPDYERDVIRPNALGRFGDLLLATARSPAMLFYLDNFSSSGPGNLDPAAGTEAAVGAGVGGRPGVAVRNGRKGGLNENYAREVMELHTLGVDGGYTQQDVTEAARILTGWTVYPMRNNIGGGYARLTAFSDDQLARRGFVHEGDFLFNMNRHDKGEKTVLGRRFSPDGGYEEGVALLEMLAHHRSTARFVCRKIAVRFVSDTPSASLVDKMATTFLQTDGDIRQVLLTMVYAPEFWSPEALRTKIKSPFELAISTVRGLHARIDNPLPLYGWITKMGEKLYNYQAPTGFPDKGQYWINTGSLLNRMNFGLAIASGRIPGVSVDLASLNDHHEPESAQAALAIYSGLLLPGRSLDETIRRLTPMLNDPELANKVEVAGRQNGDAEMGNVTGEAAASNNMMLGQVVGVVIGSPEYQRR